MHGRRFAKLVVLDVMMPGMDGPTLLKRMRLEPELARILVIFMTAKSSKEDGERLRDLSAIGVIARSEQSGKRSEPNA